MIFNQFLYFGTRFLWNSLYIIRYVNIENKIGYLFTNRFAIFIYDVNFYSQNNFHVKC